MRTNRILCAVLVLAFAAVAHGAPVDDRIAEGRAALAAHDLALARSKFMQARAADSSNQTAAALLGLVRWFALVGDPPAHGVLNGLGVSAAGRDFYDWNASMPEDATGHPVLPANYNFEAQRPFWRDTVMPTAAAVRADFAAVTDDAFTLTLTAAELNADHSITLDRADLLALQAGLRAFEMFVQAGLGQNFSANYSRLMQLAQGDTLTFRQALEENPDLLRAGPLESRLAAKAALLDFVNLYRRASSAIRARPAGLERLFMLETPQDFNDEAEFRRYLGELEKAATDYIELDDGEILVSLAPTFTPGWSVRGSLPTLTNGRFDPLTITDSSFGGVGIGIPRETFATLMVDLGYTADLGWTQLNPTPLNSQLQKYVHTGTHHIVTGTNGTLGRSADGVTWTFQQFQNAQDFFNIATNGVGVVVVVGNTQVWRSADHGATWKNVQTIWRGNNPENQGGMFGVVWDGARFLAITNGGYIWTSPDGAAWTRGNRIVPQSTPLTIIGLDYAAGRFVAGGTITQNNVTRGAIFTSTDGANWTVSFISASSGFYRTAAYGNGRWVAAAQGGRVAYSTNGGTSWAELVPGTSTDAFTGLTYANGQFVIGGTRLGTSSDGIAWSFLTNPENLAFADAVDGPGGIYLPGPQGALYRLNGTTFTRLDTNSSFVPRAMGVNETVVFNGKLFAVGSGGMVYESSNGQTFTARSTPTSNALAAITVHSGALYASGANGTVISSTDGVTWQVRISGDTTLTTSSLNEIASVNGQLLAGGGGVVLTSTNGTTWTRRSMPGPVFSIAYGGGHYVAGLGPTLNSASGLMETAIAYSSDSINWSRFVLFAQPSSITPTVAVRHVLFDDGAFLLYLTNGELLRSSSANPANGFFGVTGGLRAMVGGAKVGDTYVATTQRLNDESRAGFNYSFDGENWVLTDLPTSEFSSGTTAVFNQRIYTAGLSAVYRANRALARPVPTAGAQVVIPGRVGQSVRLSAPITASEELTYQWSYNGTAIVGATGASLNLTQITGAQAGTYTVTATGRSTGQSTTNTVTLLVVAGAPTITQQPTGGLATVGKPFSLAVTAAGSGTLTYQWFRNNVALSGATGTTLTFASVTSNDAGDYRVEVSNSAGTALSVDARVSVTALGVAPAFWDDVEVGGNSYLYAPSRLIHDGQGRFYAMWNVTSRNQDVAGGINAGALARYHEATGTLDPSFVWDERLGSPLFLAVQSDGKLLVSVSHAGGEGTTVVRVNSDGSHDTSYVAPRFDRHIRFITLQPDGKLLVAATDTITTGSTPEGTINVVNPTVYRLETNGALESSATFTPVVFTNGTGTATIFAPPVVDASGRIYFAGQFIAVNGTNQRGVARTSSAGVLDSAFANPTAMPPGWSTLNHVGRGIGIQSDGKVVAVGRFAYSGRGNLGSDPIVAVRFSESGAFDSSFAQPLRSQLGVNTAISAFGRWLLMDANDKFLVTFDRILRFNADGSPDNSWAGGSTGYSKEIFWLSRGTSTGHVYFTDMSDAEVPGNVAALNSSGARVTSFNTGGFGSSRTPGSAIILADGRLLVGGNFTHFGGLRQPGSSLFGTNGLLSGDATPFHDPGVFYDNPFAQVFAWPDGSFGVLRVEQPDPATGSGLEYDVRRFNADGTARAGWHLDEPNANGWNYLPLANGGLTLWRVQPSISELLTSGPSGWLRFFDQAGRRASDAAANFSAFFFVTRDATGTISSVQLGVVSDVQTSGDGSLFLLVAGRDGNIAVRKYSPLGAADPTYTVTPLASATVTNAFTGNLFDPVRNISGNYPLSAYSLASPLFMRVLPDGSVLVVGGMTVGGNPRAFVRLRPDGTPDPAVADVTVTSSHPLGLNPRVSGVALDDAGRFYVAGRFDSLNGAATPGLARFNRDGSLDTTWNPGVIIRDQNGLGVRMVAGRGWLHILGPVAAPTDPRPVGYKRIAIAPTAPVIAGQSVSRTVSLGETLQLYAGVFGGGDMTYQWTRNGTALLGATTPFLDLGTVKDGTGSTYVLTATNSLGTAQTTAIVIAVSNQPAILAPPASTTVLEGSTATFSVVAASESPLSYQWYFGTEAISGATAATLTLGNVPMSAAGTYKVAVTNAHGTVESAAATLTVNARPAAPTITQQPQSQTVFNGYTVTLGVVVAPPSGATVTRYDWYQNNALFNSQSSSPTTSSSISFAAPSAGTSNSYYVVVTTSNGGTIASNTATITASSVPYAVSTVSGLSTRGTNDGTSIGARFSNPQGAAGDGNGNLYVADANNHTIRKVTSSGVVTTFAGAALTSGSANGSLAVARFNSPQGLAFDTAGNFYVAGGNLIRKISGDNVTTLAGSGLNGNTDGTGTGASFNFPTRLAVDGAGNVYVSDSNNHKIRKITPSGVVTTLAGSGAFGSADGLGTAASFNNPRGIAVQTDGTVFVADSNNHTIRRIDADGTVTTVAGSAGQGGFTDASGTAARLSNPQDLFLDGAGALYVSDGSHLIRRIDLANGYAVTTIAGLAFNTGFTDATGTAARFNSPRGLGWMGNGLGIVDGNSNTIRHIDLQGVVTTLAGLPPGFSDGSGTAVRFNSPEGIARDSAGNLYVADWNNRVIRKITPAGQVSVFSGIVSQGNGAMIDGAANVARFGGPRSLAIDESRGTLYVFDGGTIRKVSLADGSVSLLAGANDFGTGTMDGNATTARFSNGLGSMAVAPNGDLYVADQFNNTIRKVTPTGDTTTIAGLAGSPGTVDGSVAEGAASSPVRIANPQGIALDAGGNVYFGQSGVVRRIDTAGNVTTWIGVSNSGGQLDGVPPFARIGNVVTLATGPDGNLYAGTTGSSVVRITPAGVVTSLFGNNFTAAVADGSGSGARLDYAAGLAIAPDGTIFISDRNNGLIRRAVAAPPITFTTNPASQAVAGGANVTFTVAATGVPDISYQWTKNGSDIANATNASLTLTNVTSADNGTYAVRAFSGNSIAYSPGATLVVLASEPNDNFANASVLSGFGGTVSGSNSVATGETGEPTHFSNNTTSSSLWYVYRPPASGTVSFDTFGSNFDTAMALYSGTSLANLAFRAQNNDAPGSTQSRIVAAVTAGTTYYLAVGSASGARGSITLNHSLVIAPQPGVLALASNQFGALTVEPNATLSPSVTVQWQRDGADIPGATQGMLGSINTAGVYQPGFAQGGAADYSRSRAAVVLVAPAGGSAEIDTFSGTGLSPAWSPMQQWTYPESDTAFLASERLEFTTPGGVTPQFALRQVDRATLFPLDRGWSVVVRATIDPMAFTTMNGAGPVREAGLSLVAASSTNPSSNHRLVFRYVNDAGSPRFDRFMQTATNGSSGVPLGISTPATGSVILRFDYDPATGVLTTSSSTGGAAFVALGSTNILTSWALNRAATLRLGVQGHAAMVSVPAGAVAADDYAAVLSPAPGPVLTAQPTGAAIAEGSVRTLTVSLSSTTVGAVTYQWFKDGVAIPGATLNNYGATTAGSYTVAVTLNGVTVVSQAAVITTSPSAPIFGTQGNIGSAFGPAGIVLPAGSSSFLQANPAAGSAPVTYRWFKDTVEIPGVTGNSYYLPDWQPSHQGAYSVEATNALGTVMSPAEMFWVTPEGGWRWRNPLPTGNGVTRVAFLNGQFLMGGIRGTLLVSNDGLNWTTRQIPAQNNIFSLHFVGGRYVAMASLNGIFTSPDAVTWTPRTTGINGALTSLQDMVSGTGRIVAFGVGGVTAVSTDAGSNWTVGNLGGGNTDTLFGATFFLNKFFGVSGDNGRVFSSADGVAWSAVATPAASLRALAYGAGRLVAVGAGGVIVTSTNGTAWTLSQSGTTNQLLGVNYVNNRFVAVGVLGTILTSPDGLVWTPRSSQGNQSNLQNTAFGNGRYVIAGQGGRVILTSTDAENWSILTSGPSQGTHLFGVAASASALVAAGQNGVVVSSSDKAQWTNRTTSNLNQLNDVTYAQNKFMIVGNSGSVMTSTDEGATWTWHSTSNVLTTNVLMGVRYSPLANAWIVVGNGGAIYTAADGNTFMWTQQTSGTSSQLRKLAVGPSLHVAVGGAGTITTSPDAATWTLRTSGTSFQLNDVAYGNGKWVAVGLGGTVTTSSDGATWNATTLGNTVLTSVNYLNGHFIATATSNAYFTSPDGVTWTGRTTGAGDQLNDAVIFGSEVVGVGNFGTILTAGVPTIAGGGNLTANTAAPAEIKFAVGNSPLPVTYQWFKNGQPISGPNAPVLRITSVQAGDAGAYHITAANDYGTATSSPVTLTTNVSIAITTQPQPQTATVGGSATFSVVATGVPAPSYQWRLNDMNIPGATSSSVTLTNLRLTDAGPVTVVLSNGVGSSVTSNPVQLAVQPVAPVITSPLSAFAVANVPFSYQIVTNQTPATFGATGLPAGLALNPTTGVISGVPTQIGTASVQLTASNTTGSDSKALTLTVQPPAPMITSPASVSGRVGQPFAYSITATNSPSGYLAANLPPGLTRSGSLISGTPTTAGYFSGSIAAFNDTGIAQQPLVFQIAPALNAPVYSGSAFLSATAGTAFSFTPNFGSGITGYALVNLPDGTASVLPNGISLNTTSGVISGTTTQTGTYRIALRATNPDGSTTQVLTFTFNPAASAPLLTSNSSAVATVGSLFTFALTSNPLATSYAAAGLPSGLTVNETTGVITGIPAEPGIVAVTITATNGTGSSTALLTITINSSALAPVLTSAPVAAGTVGVPFTFQLTASNSPTAFAVTAGTLPSPLALNASTGAITGTPTAAGQTRVWLAASNSAGGRGPAVEVLFNIARALNVPAITSNGTAAGQVGQPFQYQIIATNTPTSYGATPLPNGLAFDSVTGVISGIPSTETSTPFAITLTATNGDGTSAPKTLSVTIAPPAATPRITSPGTAGGRVGIAFSHQLTASDNPTSFASDQLPDGLSLNATNGLISGSATAAGATTVQVRAANNAGLGQASPLTITIAPPLTAPAITSEPTASGKVGVLFSYQIVATGTPTVYGVTGTLPGGLSINTSTGVISGNPADAPGLYEVFLTATNSAGTSQPQSLFIAIAPADAVPVITSATTATGMVGAAFTYQITATNVPSTTPFPPSTFLDAIDLPDGLAVNPSTGLIEGTPVTAGTFAVSLVGVNSNGTGLPRTLTLVISPAATAPVVTSGTSASAQVGTAFSYQITATNAPTSYEALDAPAWMTVNTVGGLLSGTPTTPGPIAIQIAASNSAGSSNYVTFTITIAAAANTPVVTSSQTANGRVGQAFSYDLVATLTPTSYLASGLPPGLTFDTATGQIRGTPTTSGTFSVTVSGVNASGQGQPVTLTITILPSLSING